MTNKLVVINSSKVPKIRKILLYEMKFLVPNYSCLQNPWLGEYRPQIPVLSVLNWICWTSSPNKIPGYATACQWRTWSCIVWKTTLKMSAPEDNIIVYLNVLVLNKVENNCVLMVAVGYCPSRYSCLLFRGS